MTGIFQTQCELQARRVLSNIDASLIPGFVYKEGWYRILVAGPVDAYTASQLNRYAHAVAHTDIRPQWIGAFRQFESEETTC